MNRHVGTLGANWDDNREAWTPDRFVTEFWGIAEAHVNKTWSWISRTNHMADHDDLVSVALEALTIAANEWPQWCAKSDADPLIKQHFWAFAKKRINWVTIRYLDRKAQTQPSIDEFEQDLADGTAGAGDWLNTQLNNHHPPSMLQAQLVDYISTLTLKEQLMLALVYYEEMSLDDARILGGWQSTPAVGAVLATASREILHHALSQTRAYTPPQPARGWAPAWQLPQQLTTWIKTQYDTDPDTYLRYVAANYRADISYTLDFLNRAHGHGARYKRAGRQGRRVTTLGVFAPGETA